MLSFLRNLQLLFGLILAFVAVELSAQELPPVLNFTPEDYAAENQNWAVAQGDQDFIYVANNSGLLEYDGAKWRLYNSPNNTILRSVTVVDDRVYTGSYMEFGYWQHTNTGLLEYTSLSESLETSLIEDEQFWNILVIDDLILFQSLNRIYSFNSTTQEFEIFDSESSITQSFLVDRSVYFQQEGLGLFQLQNGSAILISESQTFLDNLVVSFFKKNENYIAITQKNGIFQLGGGNPNIWNQNTTNYLSDKTIYTAKKLTDGSILLGTISSGLIHLSSEGDIVYEIDQNLGLGNNTVLSIFEDKDAHVWLGLDNGISVINTNTAFKVYTDNVGKLGSVYAAAKHKGYSYLGTNQGLFYKKNAVSNARYVLIPETKGQVWNLNTLGNELLCGHHEGTFLVNADRVEKIADIPGTWKIQSLDVSKNLAIQGNYNGLYILEKLNSKWHVRNKLTGFDISSRYFGIAAHQTIYVNHEYKGVFKLKANTNYTEILSYDLVEKLPKGAKSSLISYQDKLLYAFEDGIYVLKEGGDSFVKDTILSNGFLETANYTSGKLTYDSINDKLWAFNAQEIMYFEPGILADALKVRRIALPSKTRKDISGFENITDFGDDTYLFGNATGYILFDLKKLDFKPYTITLRTIQNKSRKEEQNFVGLTTVEPFNYKNNSFVFDYSVAEYDKFRSVVYQYRLDGMYEEWSSWSTVSQATFENLPPGDYEFNVRARIGDQISENTASYPFSIARPWYLSVVAIVIYIVLLIALFIAIQIYNRKHYRKQKETLIETNQRKLELANYESERKIMRLQNEKLQQDVDSKNRELAASTMNIVKKNELLNAIKKELKADSQEEELKSVIKIIDKNLNPKKDWEFFKEAFNNADKDFLKKIKELHPKLTPNDLKLCAYLRLNLSSKEIAPLLNISVRSVEIKRYRLRKKMDLEHEEGLVEYVLSI